MTSHDHTPNVFDPATAANPYPMFARMRASGPVVQIDAPTAYNPTGSATWLITGFAETVRFLKDPRFTVDASAIHPDAGVFGHSAEGGAQEQSFLGAKTMVSVDGAEHTRLRGLVGKVFTPRYVETLRPRIQALTDALIDRVQDSGRMEVVADFGYPLPIQVICEMLGVPPTDMKQMQVWSEGLSDHANPQPEVLRDFSAYVMQLIAHKRARPGDDLISGMIRLEEKGDTLTEGELMATVGLLIFGGHETTSNLLSIGILTLLDHPEQLAGLKADPGRIPAAVEEILRYNGPVFSPAPRYAREDVELGGQQIRRGDVILAALGSANHDERAFTDPEELNLARELNRHVAFGQGVHFCLGAPLARLEGEIAFETLLRRLPGLRLDVPRDQVVWRDSTQLRGLKTLPVAF
ncbi:cytochrome P450 family protein [Deinococcus aquiradiocola]|uniref:Cytochrome P450 hydroxylase n=1 Tax=Deinococcus aquiradiocola TaxID=393059 RepID=A0A917PH02_9DEIO|nr:cytochrome P450 [Deinococcus aquiradiocola]GGJ77661.1 cytochrome P450 hydroxylase [Deinococcus aquiradiocola]